MESPIRRIRISQGRTLVEFADDCGVNYQALYLNECGVYPTILPTVLRHLVGLEGNEDTLVDEYEEFCIQKRITFGEAHSSTELPPPVGTQHPFISFRMKLGLSRSKLAKSLCVHPAGLYRLELGLMKHLPGDLREALQVAGFSTTLIEELDYRTEEWNSGAWQTAS